jgi:hypothetical protein
MARTMHVSIIDIGRIASREWVERIKGIIDVG